MIYNCMFTGLIGKAKGMLDVFSAFSRFAKYSSIHFLYTFNPVQSLILTVIPADIQFNIQFYIAYLTSGIDKD